MHTSCNSYSFILKTENSFTYAYKANEINRKLLGFLKIHPNMYLGMPFCLSPCLLFIWAILGVCSFMQDSPNVWQILIKVFI